MNDLHHLAAAYVLDALEPDERQAFEDHYPTCETCCVEVAEFRETAARLVEPVAPPPAMKSRVMAEIRQTPQLPSAVTPIDEVARRRSMRAPSATWLAAAAAVVFIVVGAVGFFGLRGGSNIDDIVAAPDAIVTSLEGERGDIRVVWSAERDQVALFANDLPDPGDGLTYELWALTDGASVPVPAGLFTPDDGSVREALDIDDLESDGWGVTIEPEGGSEQPTGEILFVATY